MKKLNITKEQFEKSKYFKNKYGKLEYVSESGKVFKTNKGKILKFKESSNAKDEPYSVYKFLNTLRWDYNEYMLEEPKELEETGDGWKQISIMCSKSQHRKMLGVVKKYCQKYGWEYDSHRIDEDVFEIVISQWDESTLTDDFRESTKKFGRKSVKESVGDVSTDPAYVCPYCGGRDCSFEDADDSPLEGYFDGGTLNAYFYCNDCDKFYNVAYELKVKDVYPNEDKNLDSGSELEDDDL